MNLSNPIFMFNANLIFVLVAGLIVLSMIMGRKNKTTHRSNFGWWVGLGVLLLIISGFLGFSQLRYNSNTEVRHSTRAVINSMKEDIRAGITAARDSLKQGLDNMGKDLEDMEQSIDATVNKVTKSNGKKRTVVTTVNVPKPPPPPGLSEVSWTVEVRDRERKQNLEEVRKILLSKAMSSVNRWVTDRMPAKSVALNVVTADWLLERGAFPEPVDFETEEVPRANTSLKDTLHGGTLKVVLTPALQMNIIEMGYQQLEKVLTEHQFQAQWIVTIVLMGITVFAGLIALVKRRLF